MNVLKIGEQIELQQSNDEIEFSDDEMKVISSVIGIQGRGQSASRQQLKDNIVIWKWRWKRQLQQMDLQQLSACESILTAVQPNNNKDRWIWLQDHKQGFSVCSIKRLLQGSTAENIHTSHCWNNWLPSKVNAVEQAVEVLEATKGVPDPVKIPFLEVDTRLG
ncbi:hypothetical protein QVD17_14990 [Tagetes erecta]|uniref:Uncharacterized protein n=1 Tax=Tagetes erecta TaxID=13708 RepID=A0AAD8NZA6_TARER|nr:hypothetical protein QVD17_14990 [Tagetes erecta]